MQTLDEIEQKRLQNRTQQNSAKQIQIEKGGQDVHSSEQVPRPLQNVKLSFKVKNLVSSQNKTNLDLTTHENRHDIPLTTKTGKRGTFSTEKQKLINI